MKVESRERDFSKENLKLKGKTAIVTGAASGIGRSIAFLFAEQGASVVVADINDIGGEETVDLIKTAGGNAKFCHVDVTKEDDSIRMAGFAVENFGGIDILVNNAAVFVFGTVEETTQEQWLKVLGTNVIGYANTVKAVLPEMKKQGGVIINIASQSGFIAEPASVPYNTSKGAVLQLNRALAMDLAPHGIRVNAISPGDIDTEAVDLYAKANNIDPKEARAESANKALLKRMGNPEEIARVALFLASSDSSFMTGTNVVVDGGATID